jgi:hypothetical protein
VHLEALTEIWNPIQLILPDFHPDEIFRKNFCFGKMENIFPRNSGKSQKKAGTNDSRDDDLYRTVRTLPQGGVGP